MIATWYKKGRFREEMIESSPAPEIIIMKLCFENTVDDFALKTYLLTFETMFVNISGTSLCQQFEQVQLLIFWEV